jgi:peptidoglycan/xylan/chitin deacetylase (PgdA/CDA1 family)
MRTLLVRLALAAPLAFASALAVAASAPPAFELHQRLVEPAGDHAPTVALTLDACGGEFDRDVVQFLIGHRIPATIFATQKWLARNPDGLALLLAHRDLFQIEDHGANHVPAVIGAGRKIYGLPGEPDVDHLRAEVEHGATAVASATGVAPRWYRGATARYDAPSLKAIEALGFRVAGFSVNADAGASLPRREVAVRVRAARDGDVILAHVNKPRTDSGEGLIDGLTTLVERGYRFVRLGDAPLSPVAPVDRAMVAAHG